MKPKHICFFFLFFFYRFECVVMVTVKTTDKHRGRIEKVTSAAYSD